MKYKWIEHAGPLIPLEPQGRKAIAPTDVLHLALDMDGPLRSFPLT